MDIHTKEKDTEKMQNRDGKRNADPIRDAQKIKHNSTLQLAAEKLQENGQPTSYRKAE
ncbi:uncharacterized protein G2W53_028356 [Senna tora]|uniref:Uncharacterized protein n=1 Tax=Senna tora TaxID=362788 RepID=A0A834W9N8_9FABA|nr:uncharacterized protein G2W53_028356 [Senna tora]